MLVYLDNSATTKIDRRVFQKMEPYFKCQYGNASSIHSMGQANDLKIALVKKEIAALINGQADNIVFTSGATEANNMIIKGVMRANRDRGRHFLISAIEHPSVLASAKELSEEGFTFDYIPVDRRGVVKLDELKKKIKPETVLLSVMAVNNEVGSIQPLKEIGAIARSRGIYFHSDAVQAVPYLKIDVKKWSLDFLSLSAHKFYGPQGIGLAYLNKKIKIKPLLVGGGQESSYRSGTYNMAGIVGLGEALKLAYRERDDYIKKVREWRDCFWSKLKREIKDVSLNGDLKSRTPNNLNVMFKGIEGEAILIDLAMAGIYVSTGSACSAQNLKVSSVITAMGIDPKYMNSNIRFTWGRYNHRREIDYVIKNLKKTVERLRSFTPIE